MATSASFDQCSSIQGTSITTTSPIVSLCSSSSSSSSSSTTSSLATLFKKEIDHFNNGQKFYSRNRFVVDPAAESVDHWPIWPTNLYFTANAIATATAPTTAMNAATVPAMTNTNDEYATNIFREDSSDSGSDSLYAVDPSQDEPQRKRSRFSPIRPSCPRPFSGFPDTELSVSEFDCDLDLLFEFCGLPEDEQFMTSASSLSSESSSQEGYF
jgi:hypothetical protein